jgi:hypothetical protein
MVKPTLTPHPHPFGLPLPVVVALAALATIRGVVHDLTTLETVVLLNLTLVVVPLVVWVVVAAVWSSRPFRALLATGVVYGLLLGVVHVMAWNVNLELSGLPEPALGGNLEGVLPPVAEAILFRVAAVLSSVAVGALTGSITGGIAWLLRSAATRRRAT